jgi:hypothetical protein
MKPPTHSDGSPFVTDSPAFMRNTVTIALHFSRQFLSPWSVIIDMKQYYDIIEVYIE